MIVLDASAAASLLLQQSAATGIVREIDGHELVSPELMSVELLSVLRGWVRSRQLDDVRAREALEDLEALGITWYSERPLLRVAWSLRENASAYDAIYLALARTLTDPGREVRMLTLDRRIARAFPQLTRVPEAPEE